MDDAPSELRAVNTKIAGDYDRVPYDPTPVEALDAGRVLGLAALYGAGPANASYDVLDLGCGTGVQLARVAAQNGGGRVVGVDLSQSACALATERCAGFGARARVICSDFLDLDAEDLGQFDLIYHVGVLYITPPRIQRRLLDLIARSLKPGGVAVISYYYGLHALMIEGLRDTLHLAVDRTASPDAQVQSARGLLRNMGGMLVQFAGEQHPMLSVLQNADARSDSIFYHEILGTHFEALSTAALEHQLGGLGVHFLNGLAPGPSGRQATARERALVADTFDYAGGGYRYSVFAKTDPARAPDPKVDVLWETPLVRQGPQSPAEFRDPASGLSITAHGTSEVALDVLAGGPRSWPALIKGVSEKVSDPKTLEDELLLLWQYGLVSPLWRQDSLTL